jgi:type I restriction enzyme S subunit
MEAISASGAYQPMFTMRIPSDIKSGTYFERGDILVAKITPSFENGKQALVLDLPTSFGYATTEVIPLRPRDNRHDPRFLFFYLLHPDIRHHVAERMEGSTGRQRVPESVLLDLPIPDLSRQEQTDIVAVLEAIQALSAVEARCLGVGQELKRSAMNVLFTRGLRGEPLQETEIGTLPASWGLYTVLDLCQILSGGTPRKSVAEYWNGDVPWVSGKDLKLPRLDDAIDHITQEGVEAGSRLAPANQY